VKRLIVLFLLAACSPEQPLEPAEPVVIYTAFEDDSHLVDAFDRYKEKTGVLVIVRRGPAERIIGDVIDNDISPPADLLLTDSVVHAWRAAEEGALRPLFSERLRTSVPGWARDADDLWFGTGARGAVIVHNLPASELSGVDDFTALAEQRFAGSLCMTSSSMPVNRVVMAMMISELGVRSTELTVRDWVKNLALPPFDTEARLLDAISEGTCGIAVVTEVAAAGSGLDILVPAKSYADVATLGVARHARNPDGAAALAEWLVTEVADMQITGGENISRRNVSLVALHNEEARLLAERARYR
jgi:iron(III) transport system substrate-binding protein